jgi:hypothetical protein
VNRRASVFQDVSKNLLSHAARFGLSADSIHNAFKFIVVTSTNAVVLFRRHDHGHIAVLAANKYRFALRRVEEGGESLFSVGGTDGLHLSIIDKLDENRRLWAIATDPVLHYFCVELSLMPTKIRLRNVTVTLEEEVAQWARIEAARLDTSVSRLLGELLKERMGALAEKSSVADAIERLASFGKRHKLSLRGLKIKNLMNEGRR